MKKIISTILILIAFASTVQAEEVKMEDRVKDFINDVGGKIISIASEKGASEEKKKAKIIQVIDESIDSEWISRFVLGKNYKNVSDENKAQFSKLYRDFMINTYGPKFKNYNGRKFEVVEVNQQGGFYIAKSEFLPKDSNVPIDVQFKVKERNGKLVILDFIAEGISLIETQRSEFNSAISQKGVEKFLSDLEVRVKNLKSQK